MPEFDDLDPYYGEQPVRRPAATPPPAATAVAPTPAPTSPESATEEPQRSKWEGMGVGGGTVRAHWETDEDDQAETVRVVIDAPPPPPPPPTRKSNGSGSPVRVAAPAATAVDVPSDQPPFDLATLHQQWPSLINQIWKSAIERAPFLSAQLVGVEGRCLIVQASSGALNFVNDEKRRAIRGRLIETLGRGADIRFIDDKTQYVPPASTSAAGGAPAAPAIPARPPLPTSDPVIQAGLRFFGGPIERLPDD